MKKREDFSKEGQKSNPFTVRFKKTFLEDIKKRRGLVKGQQIADFLVDMYNQTFNPIVGNPIMERALAATMDKMETDMKIHSIVHKNKNVPRGTSPVEHDPNRPEPPAGLKGIDLTIWKRENWK